AGVRAAAAGRVEVDGRAVPVSVARRVQVNVRGERTVEPGRRDVCAGGVDDLVGVEEHHRLRDVLVVGDAFGAGALIDHLPLVTHPRAAAHDLLAAHQADLDVRAHEAVELGLRVVGS